MYKILVYADNVRRVHGAVATIYGEPISTPDSGGEKYEPRIAEVFVSTAKTREDARKEVALVNTHIKDRGGLEVDDGKVLIFFPLHRIIKIEAREVKKDEG